MWGSFSEKLTGLLAELMEKLIHERVLVGMLNVEEGARIIEARL